MRSERIPRSGASVRSFELPFADDSGPDHAGKAEGKDRTAAWPVGLCAGAVWLALAALGRMSSLAALMSFALAPIFAAVLADATVVKLALVIAVLVFVRHHANIRRLIAGTEPRIGQKA